MKKVIALISVLLGVVFLTGCSLYPVSQTQPTAPAPVAQQPASQVQPTEEVQKSFISNLLAKLPSTYIVSETDYWKSFGEDIQKATLVEPCEDKADPTFSPICSTILTILEEKGETDSLEAYIKGDSFLSGYEGYAGEKLVWTTYQDNIPLVYTPNRFMCLGTGGDGCMRKQYIYHLPDGKNILAEISFMPYINGEPTKEPIKEVQDIIKIYEDVLTK